MYYRRSTMLGTPVEGFRVWVSKLQRVEFQVLGSRISGAL